MHTKRLSLTLTLALILTLGLLASLSLAAPGNPAPHPDPNTHTAPPNTTVSLTYSETMDAATVNTQTFAVYAFQTGLLTATFGVDGNTIILTPTRPFFPGELVQTTATTRTLSITGEQPLSYTVWGFCAAVQGGSGVFSAHPISRTFGEGYSWDIALGDVDGDGDLDAIVANIRNQAQDVHLNDGSGVFSPHPSTPTFGAGSSRAVALGDVDGDGDLDALVANNGVDKARDVYLNDGGGAYSPHPSTPTFGVGESLAVALGDVDGDGDLDAVTANDDGAAQEVHLNDGSGAYAPHPSAPTFGAGESYAVALGDVDGDGDLDALVANLAQLNDVYVNDGSGAYAPHPSAPTFGAGQGHSWDVALGDVDGDGDLDAIVANDEHEAQGVYVNDGGGAYSPHPSAPTFGAGSSSIDVALGDVDGDGDLDALVTNLGAQAEDVYVNDGSGAFSPHPSAPTFGAGWWSYAVALGDVDGDGDLDAIFANLGAQTVWLNRNYTDLSITKSVQVAAVVESIPPGAPLTYTLAFSNASLISASGVVITDHLPLALTQVGVTSSGATITRAPGISRPAAVTYAWQVDDLAPGEGGVITITGIIDPEFSDGVVVNTATIASAAKEVHTDNNSSSVEVTVRIPPALQVFKSVQGPGGATTNLMPGDVVTYTIALENSLDEAAAGVVMTDPLPAGVSFGGWVEQGLARLAPSAGTGTLAREIITWGPYSIPSDESVSIVFTASLAFGTALSGAEVLNTAWFSSTDAASGSDSAVFTIKFMDLYLPLVMRSTTP